MSWKGLLEFSRLTPTYSLQLCCLFMHNCKQSRGLGHILWPAGNTTVNTAQEVLDLLYCNFSVLGQGQLVVHQGPPLSSSADLLFSWMTPRVFRCMELSLPRCKTLHLLIELHEIPASPFLQPGQVMSLWMPTHLPGVSITHSNLVLSAVLLSLPSAPTPRSLMMSWEPVWRALLKSRLTSPVPQFHCRRLPAQASFSSLQILVDYSQPLSCSFCV